MTTVVDLYSSLIFDLNEEDRLQLLMFQQACQKEDLDFFKSSLVPFSEKKKVLDQLNLSESVLNLLYQITLKKRWSFFDKICAKYLDKKDEKEGILKGIVFSRSLLEKDTLERIKLALSTFFKGKSVYLENQKSEDLVKGIRVEIGGFSFDDSILYHFNQFKEQVRKYGN